MEEDEIDLRPRQTTTSIGNVGMFRLLSDLAPIEVTYLLIGFVSCCGALIITIDTLKDAPPNSSDFTWSLVLVINIVFVIWYMFHGVFRERPFELVVSTLATAIVMLYCIVEFAYKGHRNAALKRDIKLGRLIVISMLGPINIVLGLIIAKRFFISKNLIFKTVGGNSQLQSICQTLFMFTASLKIDFQLLVSLVVLYATNGKNLLNLLNLQLEDYLVLGIGLPFIVAWLVIGFLLGRFESRELSGVFWATGMVGPGFIIYLLVLVAKTSKSTSELSINHITDVCIFVGGGLSLVMRGVVLALSVLVTKNFGRGLREKVYAARVPVEAPVIEPIVEPPTEPSGSDEPARPPTPPRTFLTPEENADPAIPPISADPTMPKHFRLNSGR